MNSEQETVELTSFQFPEPDPEVLDEIIEVSKFIILLCSNFYPFNMRVPVIVPLIISTLLSINGANADSEFKNTLKKVKVGHFDCSKIDSNKMYSLNKIAPCDIDTEKIKVSEATATIMQRNYKTKLEATMCKATHQRLKWYCDTFDDSGLSATQATISSDIKLTAEQCLEAKKTGSATINTNKVPFTKNVKKQTVINKGDVSDKYSNECTETGWIYHDTYETYMQDIKLLVNLEDGTVNNHYNIPLPCSLNKNGCDSGSTDPYAYTWENRENCIKEELHTAPVKMIQIDRKYYIVREYETEPESTEAVIRRAQPFKGPRNTFIFQIYNNPQSICDSNKIVYPTPYSSLYIHYEGGFDMDTGKAKKPIPNVVKNTYVNSTRGKLLVKRTSYTNGEPNNDLHSGINYEAHMGTKFDYYEYTNIRRLQLLDLQMIKTDCELERAIKRTNLVYSHSNPRMAGFLLTNNRSMFLETNDNVAWLYHCPQYFSPLQIMEKCYNRIPIMYQNKIHFVDPITRKTYTSAEERSCVDKHDNLFQLDIEDDNSWVELTPGITRVKGPSVFEPNISPQRLTKYKFQDSDEIYLFTDQELKKFWRGMKFNNEMKDAIQTFSKELVVSQDNFKSEDRTYLNYPMRTVYLDSFISPNFFDNRYIEMFGYTQFILEQCGIYFAAFLFLKFIIQIVVTIVKALQIHKITGASVNFGKIILFATYNILFTSIMTSIFKNETTNEKQPDDAEHLVTEMKETHFNLYPHIPHPLYSAIRNERHENNVAIEENGDNPISPV